MIEEYKRILVAIDGSKQSLVAFRQAIAIAKRNRATLFILQVVSNQKRGYGPYSYGAILQQEQEQVEIENQMLKHVAYALENKITSIEPIVQVGNPKTTIAFAIPDKYDIDLIVLGASGKGAVNRFIVGSTANYTVKHANCNVLVVKTIED